MKKKSIFIAFTSLIVLASLLLIYNKKTPEQKPKLHICTEATYTCPNLDQLIESCRVNQLKIDVVGLNDPNFSFGKKLRDYKAYLEKIPDHDVVLFLDAFDTLVLSDAETILQKFKSMDAPFVISVETNCFPFAHLAPYYPPSPTKFKYINAGSYIGYAGYIKKIMEELSPIPDETDDQGLLSVYYLYHPDKFKLDYQCELFLPLFQVDQKELVLDSKNKSVSCLTTNTSPCVIHGNGPAKYMYQLIYDQLFKEDLQNKTILLAILARNKAHLLTQYLKCLENLDYDKKLITIYINTNNNDDNTVEILEDWAKKVNHQYCKIIMDNHQVQGLSSTKPHEWTAERFKALATIRNKSMQKALEHHCDYYFVVDCDNFIAPFTLKELISKDKPIIAPLLKAVPEPNDLYSNYFCACDEAGYYHHHPDYIDILNRSKSGTFKVPVVHCTYLINTKYIDKLNYIDNTNDYEFIVFSRNARKNKVDQYICNEKEFGTLLHFHDTISLEEEKNRFQKMEKPL